MPMRSAITATGSYLPARVMSNDEIAQRVDTSDAWIRERSGITQRHIAAEGELTSHLATFAAQSALTQARYDASHIDGIVLATSTPDQTMPSTAAKVQAALGITRGPALDVAAACTGFVYALSVAHGWIQTGIATRVLVIGAEIMSRIINWDDRGTCILFGDGAGAVILEAIETESNRGILALQLAAEGAHANLLGTDGGIASTRNAGHLFMQGQEVFRHGVDKMSEITKSTMAKAGLALTDMDWLIPHQANARMIRMIGNKLGVPESKCIVTVAQHANTSAATIPLALDVANRDGRLGKKNIVAMPALGAGLTWGCCVISW